jgi:hypothetical protein
VIKFLRKLAIYINVCEKMPKFSPKFSAKIVSKIITSTPGTTLLQKSAPAQRWTFAAWNLCNFKSIVAERRSWVHSWQDDKIERLSAIYYGCVFSKA